MPIEHRLKYKILLLVFKSLNNLAPSYLVDMLELYIPVRTLRSTDQRLLIEKSARTRYGERAFSVTGPALWNRIPAYLRFQSDVICFKRDLKTYLFKQAFNV